MKTARLGLAVVICLILTASVCSADQEQDVKALVDNAAAFVQDKGQDYSMKVFSALNGPFVKGPLYVVVGDFGGQIVAHPNKKVLGSSLWETKDVKGKFFVQEIVDVAKKGGDAWVEYWWPNPLTKEDSLKRSYVKRVPGADMWILAGYYVE
jgi:signal transduction histidine kinase